MNRTALLPIVLATAAFAGLFTTPAVRLDDAQPGQIDLRANGLLAHVCAGGYGGAIQVDLKRLSDAEKFRIAIDPRVRTIGAVVLQQLPPGSYTPTRLFLGENDPVSFSSDTFEIQPGRITSFGKIKVDPQTNLLGQLKRLVVKTDSLDISPRLSKIADKGVDSLPVTSKPIDWRIEPPEIQIGKRLSP